MLFIKRWMIVLTAMYLGSSWLSHLKGYEVRCGFFAICDRGGMN